MIELRSSVAQTVYDVGDAVEVCWNINPDDVPFTVTVSVQAPTSRIVAGPFADSFDAGCAKFVTQEEDIGSVTIAVQARAPSGATATAPVQITVRDFPR